MGNWIIHSEKRQWKDHEYEERVIEGEGVPASNIKHSDEEDVIYVSREECLDYLKHHGILGQKWGIRRYQNPDGTLTPEGKARYGANFEKGIPKQTLKKALKDYNTRTGSNLKLKDARTIRVGQYLYDKNGRRVKEDVSAEVSDAYKKKQAQARAEEQRQIQQASQNQQKQPKQKGVVGSWIASKAGKALNNITDTALDVGKDYLRKQLREAVGLDKEEGPRNARTQAELLKKSRDNWTAQDYQFYNSIQSTSNARSMNTLSKKKSGDWTPQEVEFYSKYKKAGLGDMDSITSDRKQQETTDFINDYAEAVYSNESLMGKTTDYKYVTLGDGTKIKWV